MTRIRALLAAAALTLAATGLTACGPATPGQPLIAISAPGEGSDAWGVGIDELRANLEDAGYQVEVRRAGDDIPTQNLQLDELIAQRPEVLVVAPVDGTSLGLRIDRAKAVGVPVVVYDRMADNSQAAVEFFVGFDHELAGRQQAWSLLHGLGLTDPLGQPLPDAPAGPFAIELLAGDLNDFATEPMFNGALEVLQPYLDAGTLVIPSGITQIQYASPTHGEPEDAAARIRDLLGHGERIDAILSPDDPISLAVIEELPTPDAGGGAVVVTGCGASRDSIRAIEDGLQFSTVSEDPRRLARALAEVVDAIAGGETPTSSMGIDDPTGQSVRGLLVEPTVVDATNADDLIAEPGSCIRPGLAR